ncbi:MAG TPA: N-6 DNA methylase, partial [Chloroflexota bacterium]|nr:N-6 DNA methylase [Chloroflexota bacterium]
MPPLQPALAAPAHNNQRLFSDHYLDATLPGLAAWHELTDEAAPITRQIAGILDAYKPSANEQQTERDLVRPILAALGHTFEVQATLATPHGAKRPDYILYPSQNAVDAHKNLVLDDSRLQGALAVGEAKHWDRPLDQSGAVGRNQDPLENRMPTFQIAFYLQHSGLIWGILTNGRLWRLYHRDSAHKLDRFYEVDLPALLASDDPSRFLYFYAFFSRRAFADPILGIDAMLRASVEYAHGVGESLKQQVYDSLRHLAQGFFDYPANSLQPDSPTLKAIYDSSLIVLYRLLFILYAEARDLLPVRENDSYREHYSLRSITRDVADDLRRGVPLLSRTASLWQRLQDLFGLIDQGSPTLKIGTFDGGLFDPAKHPFLEKNRVGDAHLQRAIDSLARVDGHFIDYRDLAERHLGAIYEGLLEFHLEPIPPEDGWSVVLVTDKGERKATGSYYTPDYIVKYIVEQAVGPVLRVAVEGKQSDQEKLDAILAVKVVDPAMGSGHFPVEVVEYIARFLVDQGITPAEGSSEADLAFWKRRVAQSCVYGVDLNPLAVDLAKLSLWLATAAKDKPLSFLDHHLRPGNAVVGGWVSDLRPHLGGPKPNRKTKEQASQAAAGQLSMLDDDAFRQSMSTAVSSMWLIGSGPGDTLNAVKQQEQAYGDLRRVLAGKYERLADLVTASHFGAEFEPKLLKPLAEYAAGRGLVRVPQFDPLLDAAEAAAAARRFFHWELEFPEVFFDRHGHHLGDRAGFDAVVGNPPYVRQELLSPLKRYLQTEYASFDSVADLYVYFYERGLRLLRRGGRLAFISSGTFARANFAKPFRQYLPGAARLDTIVDFGENQPFPEAEMVRPSIVVLAREKPNGTFRSLFIADKVPSSLDQAVARNGVDCDSSSLALPEWTFQSADDNRLLVKLIQRGRTIGALGGSQIFRGVTTGLNEAFVIDGSTQQRLLDRDTDSAELLKPVVQGQDLRPWYREQVDRWLIFARRGVSIDRYPAVLEHLRQYEADLQPRSSDADSRGRKPGIYKWYEIQDTIDYYAEFARPKILWPDIAKLPRFS